MSRVLEIIKLGKVLLRQWDWGLFLLIFLFMALPRFYRSYSVYLIGNAIPDPNALATVAQWQFIELLLEVVQETFVLAIFFFVGRGIQSKEGPGLPDKDINNNNLPFLLCSRSYPVCSFR